MKCVISRIHGQSGIVLPRRDGLEMPIDVIGLDSGHWTRLCERVWLDVDDPHVVLTRGVAATS